MYPCPDKAVNTSPFQDVAFRVLSKKCIPIYKNKTLSRNGISIFVNGISIKNYEHRSVLL